MRKDWPIAVPLLNKVISGITPAEHDTIQRKWIVVRNDTRFREDGLKVEQSSLHSSTRVFVRAGKNLDDQIEAYEIVWGEILTPAPSH